MIAVAVLTAVTLALLFLVKRSPRLDDHTRPGYPAEARNRRKYDGTCPAWVPWFGPDDPSFSHEHECIRPPHRGEHVCECGARFSLLRRAERT